MKRKPGCLGKQGWFGFFYSSGYYCSISEKPAEVEMFARLSISNQKGFTLIELVSVMVIIGVLATVIINKFNYLSDTASQNAIWDGVKELNDREILVWTKSKLSDSGWISDADDFAKMNTNLGPDYHWPVGPTAAGGTLSFRSKSMSLGRTASTTLSMGRWWH